MKTKAINREKVSSRKKKGDIMEKEAIKMSSIVYDENIDILEVFTNDNTEYCENFDDFIIVHFNKNKKLIGLEFLDISKNLGMPKKILNNLKSVEISVTIDPKNKNIVALRTKMVSNIEEKQTNINFISTPISIGTNLLNPIPA